MCSRIIFSESILILGTAMIIIAFFVIRSSNIRNSYNNMTYFTLLASPAISFIIP